MTAKALFADRRLYWAWGLVSAGGLAAAAYVDPYVLGFAAFGAAAISGLVGLGAAALSWRRLPWAAVAAVPTAVAFQVLSTYKWA